jgi:hypothetical protein
VVDLRTGDADVAIRRERAGSIKADALGRPRNRLAMTLFSRIKINYESVAGNPWWLI